MEALMGRHIHLGLIKVGEGTFDKCLCLEKELFQKMESARGKIANSALKATRLHSNGMPSGTEARGSQWSGSQYSCCLPRHLPFLALPHSYCPSTRLEVHISSVEKGTLLQSWGVWEGASGTGGIDKCIIWFASQQLQS